MSESEFDSESREKTLVDAELLALMENEDAFTIWEKDFMRENYHKLFWIKTGLLDINELMKLGKEEEAKVSRKKFKIKMGRMSRGPQQM